MVVVSLQSTVDSHMPALSFPCRGRGKQCVTYQIEQMLPLTVSLGLFDGSRCVTQEEPPTYINRAHYMT